MKANHAHTYFKNDGSGNFAVQPFDNRAQFSTVNTSIVEDIHGDNQLDLLVAGNLLNSEDEHSRKDASYGLLIKGDSRGNLSPVSPAISGLYIDGEVRSIQKIILADNTPALLIAKGQAPLQILTWMNNSVFTP